MPTTIELDLLEYAVLAEKSGINRVPTIASYSNHGTAVTDVVAEFDDAEQRCRRRRLIDDRGRASDEVWDLLGIYPSTSVEFDLRFSAREGTEVRASVSRTSRGAVRTIVDGDRVRLEELRTGEAIASLVSALPPVDPLRTQPLSIDLSALRAATAETGGEDQAAIERSLRSHGVDVRVYRRITELLAGPKLGAGELGVTAWGRDRREHRGEQTVRVYDLESGRVVVHNSRGTRMLVGADMSTFHRVLDDLVSDTQRRIER